MPDISNEALIRIEHKLDLILTNMAETEGTLNLTAVGDDHVCPLCFMAVTYRVDALEKALTRICGCSTNMQSPINLEPFAPTPPKENDHE